MATVFWLCDWKDSIVPFGGLSASVGKEFLRELTTIQEIAFDSDVAKTEILKTNEISRKQIAIC